MHLRIIDAVVVIGGLLVMVALACVISAQQAPTKSATLTPGVIRSLADVPVPLRTPNYQPFGQGSCVHASNITILRWMGQNKMADWWKDNYNSGEFSNRLILRLEAANLRYAYTTTGDVQFLEWMARNRYVGGIFYFPAHSVNIVDLTATHAVLLDNNRVQQYIYIPRQEFVTKWKNEYGGFAWTVLSGNTPAPWPTW